MDSHPANLEKGSPPLYQTPQAPHQALQPHQQSQQPYQPYHHQQPVGQQPRSFATGGAQAPAQFVGQGQGREWSTGLCACGGDCAGFCLSCWCPCITYGDYKQRLDSLKLSGRALPKDEVECCSAPALLYLSLNCLTGFSWIFDFMARDEIKQRYHIRENSVGGCLKSWCCVPCAQRQQHRELKREEEAQWGAQHASMTV